MQQTHYLNKRLEREKREKKMEQQKQMWNETGSMI